MTEFDERGSAIIDTDCPCCGKGQDRASSTSEKGIAPHAGAVALCITCGFVAIYDHDAAGNLVARVMTPAETGEVLQEPEVRAAVIAWYTHRQNRFAEEGAKPKAWQ